MMKNFIKYGTNNQKEIWLQKYGFGFEEIDWLAEHIKTIDENKIVFKKSVLSLPEKKYERVKRYLYKNNVQ